ncbi:MAG: tyrosine-type recombinase/integrase [Candidatus Promineifilaceae bacterium]|nr:tyrosine-type recombinase/integrase [Candidatus Promineifilaceae bacterium]
MPSRAYELPLSTRPLPDAPSWLGAPSFLLEAGSASLQTETTYRSALRLFADWLQHYGKDGYTKDDEWPLEPAGLTTATILNFRSWLLSNRSRSTATTYMAAVTGYLNYLDGQNQLPEGVQLGKLGRQLARRSVERHQAETVIDLDDARQAIPQIVAYYDNLPLPPENDAYNRRQTLLRNRALVHTLYSTAARISEVVALNRRSVDEGRSSHASIVGKGNKPRTIHFRDYARKAIRAYLQEREDGNPALFVAHSRNAAGARLSTTSAHNVVKKAVRALDLHSSLSAHDFRHYRATQLLREGMPIEVVQEFLGHADISTTRSIYAPVLGIQVVDEWLENMDISPEQAVRAAAAAAESSAPR